MSCQICTPPGLATVAQCGAMKYGAWYPVLIGYELSPWCMLALGMPRTSPKTSPFLTCEAFTPAEHNRSRQQPVQAAL